MCVPVCVCGNVRQFFMSILHWLNRPLMYVQMLSLLLSMILAVRSANPLGAARLSWDLNCALRHSRKTH